MTTQQTILIVGIILLLIIIFFGKNIMDLFKAITPVHDSGPMDGTPCATGGFVGGYNGAYKGGVCVTNNPIQVSESTYNSLSELRNMSRRRIRPESGIVESTTISSNGGFGRVKYETEINGIETRRIRPDSGIV